MKRLSTTFQRFIFLGLGLLLGILSLLTPYWEVAEPVSYVGGLLMWAAILELIHGFRRAEDKDRQSAWISGAITLIIGVLMMNATLFDRDALIQFIRILFFIDAVRYTVLFVKEIRKGSRAWPVLLSALGNGVVVVLITVFYGRELVWLIALCGALRVFGTLYNLFMARIGVSESVSADVVASLNLSDNKELEALAFRLSEEDKQRASLDTGWIITFLLILFFIHLGRMGFDQSASGVLSPIVAVIGDVAIALIIAYGIIAPLRLVFRSFTGLFVRSLWKWVHQVPEHQLGMFSLRKLALLWLTRELRISISLRKSGYALVNAVRNGLKIGLPFSALLAAIIPVLGMSWYFDTENWASGVWDGYASSRAEVWREAMIHATTKQIDQNAFRLTPAGVTDTVDFSFVVIGDTGEGDASQLVLKDQLLKISNKPDVRFVVISSDVVYPSGAMKDYERKFFLPFQGVTKPIYAIPGNHDWYDALDGFTATFFTPSSAGLAIEARVRSDYQLTGATGKRIDQMVDQAAFLRHAYQVPVGYQTAPFFYVANDYFLLLTIDTGVLRRVDDTQLSWIKSVLDVSKGKYVMVLLGHPFYAIGEYQGNLSPEFRELHELLRSYKVNIVMAGDTHDLEYYKELPQHDDGHTMHHFVNGGGGAYLSIGAAMAPAETRPTKDWANYPSREPLIKKIDSLTKSFKYPAWIWVKKYNGYPFSAEWLSAAFDYNQAPYFQSFMEIMVEPSRNRIRLIPYGIHGQLKWSDFDHGGETKPRHASEHDLAEWIFPLR